MLSKLKAQDLFVLHLIVEKFSHRFIEQVFRLCYAIKDNVYYQHHETLNIVVINAGKTECCEVSAPSCEGATSQQMVRRCQPPDKGQNCLLAIVLVRVPEFSVD